MPAIHSQVTAYLRQPGPSGSPASVTDTTDGLLIGAKIGTCSKVRLLQGTRSIASSVSPCNTCACRGLHSAMLRILMRGGVEVSSSIICIPTPAILSSGCAGDVFGDLKAVRRSIQSQNVCMRHSWTFTRKLASGVEWSRQFGVRPMPQVSSSLKSSRCRQ